MKHLSEEQLLLYHYGEPVARRAVEDHLASCHACRADYQALQQVLAAVEAAPVPERGEGYGREVWARLQPRLGEAGSPGLSWDWFRPRRWALAGVLAAVLLAGILVGRFTAPPEQELAGPDPEQVRERILLVAVSDHLERSQMVLVELVNASGNGTVDISAEQAWAQELVADNRLYRQTATQVGEAGLVSVLDELERVLLEIAHSPSALPAGELQQIQQRIEGQGILFKVRVLGWQMREREQASVQEPVLRTM